MIAWAALIGVWGLAVCSILNTLTIIKVRSDLRFHRHAHGEGYRAATQRAESED